MNDHPILFNSEMIKAVLDGRKTMTRRVIKGNPSDRHGRLDFEQGILKQSSQLNGCWHVHKKFKCPYGKIGDVLWVRENTRTICYGRGDEFEYGEFCIEYLADDLLVSCPKEHHDWWRHNWHIRPSTTLPSIFMPRWASRITLEITAIRVERVQKITRADAVAEGIIHEVCDHGHLEVCTAGCWPEPEHKFRDLWDSINKKRGYGWDVNPWCWCVEFRRIDK